MKFCKFIEKENRLEFIIDEIFFIDSVEQLSKKAKFLNYMKYLYLVYDNDSFLVRGKKRLPDRKSNALEYTKLTDKDLKDDLFLKVQDSFMWWNYTNSMKIRDRIIENVEKLLKYTDDADLNERVINARGVQELLHDPKTIAAVSKSIIELQGEIKKLDSAIESELEERGKARGNKSSSPLEKGVFDKRAEMLIRGEL